MDFRNDQVTDADHHIGDSSNDLLDEADLRAMEEAEFNEYMQANQLMSRNITFTADPAAEPPPPWQTLFNSAEDQIHHDAIQWETTSKSEDHQKNHDDAIVLLSRAEVNLDDDQAVQAFLDQASHDLDGFNNNDTNNNNPIVLRANDSDIFDAAEWEELQQKFNEKIDVSEDNGMKPAIVANGEAKNSLQLIMSPSDQERNILDSDIRPQSLRTPPIADRIIIDSDIRPPSLRTAPAVEKNPSEENILNLPGMQKYLNWVEYKRLHPDEEDEEEEEEEEEQDSQDQEQQQGPRSTRTRDQAPLNSHDRIVSRSNSPEPYLRILEGGTSPSEMDSRPISVDDYLNILEEEGTSPSEMDSRPIRVDDYLNIPEEEGTSPSEMDSRSISVDDYLNTLEEEGTTTREELNEVHPDVVMESELQAVQTMMTREALEEEEDGDDEDENPVAKRLKPPDFGSRSPTPGRRSPETRGQSPVQGATMMISDDQLPEPSGFAGDSSSEPSMVCAIARNAIDCSSALPGPQRARPSTRPWPFHERSRRIVERQGDDADEEGEEKPASREEAYGVATGILQSDQFKVLALQLHPRVLGFCYMLCNSNQSISEAWDLTETGENVTQFTIPVPRWTPLMYVDPLPRLYVRYFPCVLGMRTMEITGIDPQKYVPANNSIQLLRRNDNDEHPHSTTGPEHWLCLPSLRYLPLRMDRIIAAAAGLLAVDGGIQPCPGKEIRTGMNRTPEWIRFQSLNDKYWRQPEYEDAKGQSMLVVTNPLTKEYRLLPPIPRKKLMEKVGAFIFTDASRTAYRLIVVGWVKLNVSQEAEEAHKASGSTYQQRPQEEAALVIYSSQHERWVHFDKVSNARPCSRKLGGRSGCVVMNYGVFFAGLRVTPKPLSRTDITTAAIFYFNCSSSRRQQLVFDFNGTQLYAIKASEPPKIVAAGHNRVYAVSREPSSRATANNMFVFIVDVVLNADGSPKGSCERLTNGIMPTPITEKLFRGFAWHKDRNYRTYDVHGGDHVIAFKVSIWDPDIALYHLDTGTWSLTAFPTEAPKPLEVRDQRDWLFVEGIYEPMWLAIP
ncbi:unnamed protein product [Sphagnum troendelagicum]|uniref:Uncharacterized protein n=1 Tax=Sphagnum troendelagicum TaxID=128251 RepID=A0ABP0TFP9_9BRYO